MKRIACPKCHCTAYTKQGNEKTKYRDSSVLIYKERRKCKYCGTKYTVETKERDNLICPYCNSKSTRKEGYSKSGIRKYYCNTCKKHFQDRYENTENKLHRISEHNKMMIVKYHTGGFSNKFISKLLKVGETSVKRILDRHDKLRKIKYEAGVMSLTKAEYQIYELLRTKNKIVTIQKLLESINTDEKLLRVHICNLRSKMKHSDNPYMLSSIYGKGYTLSL